MGTRLEKQAAEADREIAGLTSDSRRVRRDYLFAALPGGRADGRAYVADAVGKGAMALLVETGVAQALRGEVPERVALLEDDNPRKRFALLAARVFSGQPDRIAAVTGTNGKTSVVNFARQMWTAIGESAASVGTLGVTAPDYREPGTLTTPDPVELHRILSELKRRGVDRLAMEASSHGLDQYRLDGVQITAAVFTNLTRDHLDYHKTFEAYLAAKLRLFAELLPAHGLAVINADSPEFETVADVARKRHQRIVSFGAKGDDVRIVAVKPTSAGQHLTLAICGRRVEADLPLIGAFQASNVAAALGLLIACGESTEACAQAVPALTGVPGRMELAATLSNGAAIYVDYAHTPDGLANALASVRPHATGKLVVVFGCGGDRDPGKRPEMGRIAVRLADRAVVTDDNPRSESASAIRAAVLAGATGAMEIGDRAQAIAAAIASLESGDVLLIAGKGHEQGQIIGDRVIPFDDRQVAREAARSHGGR
ncbi:MAG: UDP-N-acetylmuramoyl-L-alanyl-D-glutamate--2,6-diaminopimelate ligase [Gemmatimonas sp.]